MEIKNEEAVVETPEVQEAAPTPAESPEDVASPEVKEEVETPQKRDVEPTQLQEQIQNLNTALKQERESNKSMSQELKDELAKSRETIDKLKSVFVPEQPKEDLPQENLTMSQIEELLESRERQKQEELAKEQQTQTIKQEIATMESEWNGENGKPKYDDRKVLDWQEANSKLHLSPREAFNEMSRDSIIDWEIKNRMNKKPTVQNVETPIGNPASREPQPVTPQDGSELRNAVLEAMNLASDENIN